MQAEDGFGLDDLMGAFEGELEGTEVSEGSPAAADGRPVEELETAAV